MKLIKLILTLLKVSGAAWNFFEIRPFDKACDLFLQYVPYVLGVANLLVFSRLVRKLPFGIFRKVGVLIK